MEKSYTNLKKIKSKNDEAEFELDIPREVLEKYSDEILARMNVNFELPGFRKGKVPINIMRQHVNEMHLLEDSAEAALQDVIQEIIEEENLSIVGSPEASIIKIALNNPVTLKIKFAILSEIKLPDYKKIGRRIAERKDETESTEAEIEESIKKIRKVIANTENPKEPDKLPEVNDEFVKKLGPFENVQAFKTEIKKHLDAEKKMALTENKRDEIIREIIKNSKINIPELFLEQELRNFRHNRDHKLKEVGLTLEKYLSEVKKTAAELEKEERTLIEEQLKTRLVLREIQKIEKLETNHEEIHEHAERLAPRYPDRNHHELHHMAEAVILNEKLFDLLEGKENSEKSSIDTNQEL